MKSLWSCDRILACPPLFKNVKCSAAAPAIKTRRMAVVVGQRVLDKQGFKGTVRYVGPVATSKSAETVYAGIEWDDATRGKSDGSVILSSGEQVRYFTCPQGAGSFLKVDLLDVGVSILEALRDKYLDVSVHEGGAIMGLSGKAVPVLLVGDEQIREKQKLEKLTNVVLRDSRVAGIPAGSLASAQRIRELDLSGNLLTKWEDVVELGRQLPKLQVLNLGGNRLPALPAASLPADMKGAFPALRTLILSDAAAVSSSSSKGTVASAGAAGGSGGSSEGASFSWTGNVEVWGHLAPQLQELHLCRNGLSSLVEKPASLSAVSLKDGAAVAADPEASFVSSGSFKELRTLNLSENSFSDWGQIFSLSQLPSLSWLLLHDNQLTQIWLPVAAPAGEESGAPAADKAPLPFSALEQLNLTGNKFSHLSSIDCLDCFPALTNLRLTNSDMAFQQAPSAAAAAGAGGAAAAASASSSSISPSEARQLLISRLPRLAMLNNSEVRLREREDAEKAYTRRLAQQFLLSRPPSKDVQGITDLFGCKSMAEVVAAALAVGAGIGASSSAAAGGGVEGGAAAGSKLSEQVALPSAFKKSGDGGVIRAQKAVDSSSIYYSSPFPMFLITAQQHLGACSSSSSSSSSSSASAASGDASSSSYCELLDPFGLGSSDKAAAAALQALHPRYFLLAAKFDLHAASQRDLAAASTLASSVVTLTLRSMAGGSCMMEPVQKKLPLSMEVAAVKQLAARLFKCEPGLQRLSFRDTASSYPSMLEDDTKTLGYYAVCDGGEVLIEEVNPAEAARQAAEAARQREEKLAEQAAAKEALIRAQEMSVQASRAAVMSAVQDSY